jgi:hypothetical protein
LHIVEQELLQFKRKGLACVKGTVITLEKHVD